MRGTAALFLILPLALAAQSAPVETAGIAGTVVNGITSEPVRRALVYLRNIETTSRTTNIRVSQTATTDAAGRFSLSGIAPGKYRLSAERNGFLASEYGARGPGKQGVLLTLDAGQNSNDLTIRITPHAVITGHVLDDENEPLNGADVQVLRLQYMQGRRQLAPSTKVTTNDLGEYRLAGLQPGRYFLSAAARTNPAIPPGEEEYVTTYFPRTPDPSAAIPMDVAPGAQMRNVDIPLARLHAVTVRGRVSNETRPASASADTALRAGLSVMLSARNPLLVGTGFSRGAAIEPDGSFEFRGVTPGSYMLVATTMSAGKAHSARLPLQVSGSSVEGVQLVIRPGVPVSGRVRMETDSEPLAKGVSVLLQPVEPGGVVFGPLPMQQVKADGTFQMDDVPTERYNVTVNGMPDGVFVRAMRSGDTNVQMAGLEIGGVSPTPLDIVLSSRAGQVAGVVMDAKGEKPAGGATVVLVPQEKDRRERDIFFRTALSDASGRFNFRTVIPGEYRVYSWEDAAYGAWMDPDFMKPVESKGEAASVGDGAQVSVQLNLIPAAQ